MNTSLSADYDHAQKIGNEGDTIKHPVLARLTEQILTEMGAQSFVYAESHTGRRNYRLPKEGEWKNGIGRLSTRLQRLSEQPSGPSGQHNYSNIQPYLRACFQRPIGEGSLYLGSSGIVERICREQGVAPRFHLCDTDANVCRSLRDSFHNQPHVQVYPENGYKVLPRIECPSLALVDPILVEQEAQQILSVLENLTQKRADFVCWTALWGSDESFYQDFREETDKTYSSHWVRWKEVRVRTWGCQITVPKSRQDITLETIDKIREIMQWY
jgi:23S rRNA A2030 N6-methylase RlmJ